MLTLNNRDKLQNGYTMGNIATLCYRYKDQMESKIEILFQYY